MFDVEGGRSEATSVRQSIMEMIRCAAEKSRKRCAEIVRTELASVDGDEHPDDCLRAILREIEGETESK